MKKLNKYMILKTFLGQNLGNPALGAPAARFSASIAPGFSQLAGMNMFTWEMGFCYDLPDVPSQRV